MRFNGFEEEWKNRKIKDLGYFIGGGTPETTNPEFWEGKIPWISSSDITIDNIHSILKTRFITEDAVKLSATKLIPKGGILMVSRVGIGKFAVADEELCTSQDFTNLITTENEYFLCYYFCAKSNSFLKLSQGTSIKGFTTQDIKSAIFHLPSQDEQNKIASFLTKIDSRIETQSKIIEGLTLLKKGIAKKIFSQELRFKDDKGNDYPEWEEIKLNELMSIPDKTKANDIDKNKLLTVKLHLKGVLKNENTDTLSFGSTNYFIRKKGQFIYGKQNLFNGAFDIIPDEFDGFLSSGDVPTLDINHSKINSLFLLNLLGRKEFYKSLEDFATGSGSKRIHENTFLNVKVNYPSLPEQQKIANFLASIDNKIDIETDVLQKLEEQKKFLLQNMFV